MALQFLCARYPQYFRLDSEKIVFYNGILKTETDLKTTPPLQTLLNNVPEDFAIMLRDEKTGFYLFRAGIICSALGWNVGSKIGMRLHEIHAPIPDYKEKMQFSMDRCVFKYIEGAYSANMATDTLRRNQLTNPSKEDLGVWRSTNLSICHQDIRMRSIANIKCRISSSLAVTFASTGRLFAACPSQLVSSSTSKLYSLRLKNSATSRVYLDWC